MLELQTLLDKQLELIQIIDSRDTKRMLSFKTENSIDFEQILNTHHKSFQKEDEAYNIWNPEGSAFKYALVKVNTPLTAAIKSNNLDILKQLLNWGANINVSEPQLIYTTTTSLEDKIENSSVIKVESLPWKMPLQVAFQVGDSKIISLVLDKIDNIEKINNIRDFEDNDLFYYIYGEGGTTSEMKIVEFLALLVNAKCEFDGSEIIINGNPLLQLACELHKMPLATMLVENGANLNIKVGTETFFEFACRTNASTFINKCIEQQAMNVNIPPQNMSVNLGGTVLHNTIALSKMIYNNVVNKHSYTPYQISYIESTDHTLDMRSQPSKTSPDILLGIKVGEKPLYELLVTNFSQIESSFFNNLNIYSDKITRSKDGGRILSQMVKFLAHHQDQASAISFCKKLGNLISNICYVKEAVMQEEFKFAKAIKGPWSGNTIAIINALLLVASEDNLYDVVEIAMQHLDLYDYDTRWAEAHAPNSKFKDLIELYNNPSTKLMIDWIQYLGTLENAEQKAFLASTILEIQIMNNTLQFEFIDPLIKSGADFNAIMQSNSSKPSPSLAETLMSNIDNGNGSKTIMKALTTQKINFVNKVFNTFNPHKIVDKELDNILQILKNHINGAAEYGDLIEIAGYEKYAVNFFLTQIKGIPLFSHIIIDKSIDVNKKAKFLDYIYNQNIKVTEAELSQEINGQPMLFHLILDKEIEHPNKKLFLYYLTYQQHIDLNNITDKFGNNILHLLAKNENPQDIATTTLIDLLIEYGTKSSTQNAFGSDAISVRDIYNKGDLIRVTLKSHSTQTNEDKENIEFMSDSSIGEDMEALGADSVI